jgi:spore maturation protein SpmB
VVSNVVLFGIIVSFIILGLWKRINIYDAFIEGAKEGFGTAIKIIPYLIGILVGIAVFRASGAMEGLLIGIRWVIEHLGINAGFVDALPTALMKPLSGSGARGLMIDTMKTYGPDSFVGRLSCIFQSACDTTFYIVALYFGAVGIKNTRYAISCGLIADFVGIVAAIIIANMFF